MLTASGFGSGHFFLNLFVFVDCVFIFASVKHHIMSLDIIYFIIGTPITIAVMYGSHCIKRSRKRRIETPEAKPYEFERDEYRPEFDEFSKMLYQRRMYRGGQEL